ncbi:Glycosyl hydrolases family 43 [Friedmanniella luteola]|uniref:Glycosyl hydrolases family 43 n=1 Tax=Friedmanniella luteola TaxID=546871 RepID=A0A1H1UYV7_9ACTN|nr:family 43 glycosylhydrolase [Friedmanniella luteola]SDS77471.1 Glycosyl hydrolases family 43 [Friedmanniella luteola]
MTVQDQQVPARPAPTRAPDALRRRRRRLRGVALLASALTGLGLVAAPGAAAGPSTATYQNPVSRSFADTFADPSIIEAKDGWWYAYSTADPLRAGDEPGIMHIARTRDFVSWQYQGTVFDETNRPSWATETSGLWAPDIRYVDGRYVLYYTVTDTTLNPGDDSAIGVATSPSPTGPWTPGAAPVVAPRAAPGGGFFWTFDPSGFTDVDGQRYLYYGSYFGGVWASRVSEDGLTAVGEPELVAIDNKFEGSYVVRHGGWYYLMASSANCCAGPTTGYSVFSGRSRSPMGPFVDADGIGLTASRAGGTILVTQNGNRWIGAGHHAIATDHAGRDFVVYHALDRDKPWLTEPFGINRRPMLMDRIDWVDGWPRTRAGAGPSDSPQPAPVTGSDLGLRPADPAATGFRGLRPGPRDPQAGATALVRGTARTTRDVAGTSIRLRLDVLGDEPLQVQLGRGQDQVRVRVDPEGGRLTVRSGAGRSVITRTDAVALDGGRWHTLVVEVDRGRVLAQLSEDDLGDPFAEVRLTDADLRLRAAPLRLTSAEAAVDNVSLRRLAVEKDRLVAVPRPGALIHAEPFDRPLDADDWTWVRRDPDATVTGGQLRWPLQTADLTGPGGTAGVLLSERTPEGSWIAETKLALDLGEETVRNFQQAGLVAYRGDDDFARLTSVAIWNTRQVEFGRELVATSKGDTSYGGAIIGTPDAEMWLRLAHTRNAAGEHLYRAATSRDGTSWTWGAVWTFPAGTSPKIGLVAHGGDTPAVTAAFSYLRFYRLR